MGETSPNARQLAATLETSSNALSPTLRTREIEQPPAQSSTIAVGEDVWKEKIRPDADLLDVGWEKDHGQLAEHLVEGLENEDVWRLIRRFNKEIFHLKTSSRYQPNELDFNVVEEEDFSPNKLRAQFERLYMGVILGCLAGVQHIARLRSWREPRRSGYFCATYFLAWYLDILAFTFLVTLLILVFSPEARRVMFPPAPPALVDYQTGGLSKPQAGVLVSTDSATGAPENVKGEAVENEASNFVTGLAAIAINTLTDKDPQHNERQKGGGKTDILPEPNSLATKVAVAKDKASGTDRPSQDKTKVPMEKTMWSKMRPIMHLLCVISDVWERFANLLNPTPPFPKYDHRARIAALLGPLTILSLFTPLYWVYKFASFMFGLCLFGSPILAPALRWLQRQNYTLNNTILKGVPTNAQLTITLLRLGEAQKAPLPPPPLPQEPPPKHALDTNSEVIDALGDDQPLGVSQQEIRDAAQHDPEMVEHAGGGDDEVTESGGHGKKRTKLFDAFKHGAKGVAKTFVATDKVRAKTGAESAKKRLGAVSTRPESTISGPVEFSARYNGDKGYAYLTTDAVPSLCFTSADVKEISTGSGEKESQPLWIIPVADIKELNKYSGYGAKAKLMAGWALDAEVKDGIEITDVNGKSTIITAIPRRDQLFNRLCAIGNQRWEVW